MKDGDSWEQQGKNMNPSVTQLQTAGWGLTSYQRFQKTWNEMITSRGHSLREVELGEAVQAAHWLRNIVQLVVVQVEHLQRVPQNPGKLYGADCKRKTENTSVTTYSLFVSYTEKQDFTTA